MLTQRRLHYLQSEKLVNLFGCGLHIWALTNIDAVKHNVAVWSQRRHNRIGSAQEQVPERIRDLPGLRITRHGQIPG